MVHNWKFVDKIYDSIYLLFHHRFKARVTCATVREPTCSGQTLLANTIGPPPTYVRIARLPLDSIIATVIGVHLQAAIGIYRAVLQLRRSHQAKRGKVAAVPLLRCPSHVQ